MIILSCIFGQEDRSVGKYIIFIKNSVYVQNCIEDRIF